MNIVWSNLDPTGGDWVSGQLSYSTTKKHFFIFEAVPSDTEDTSYRGYVAIDKFSATEGVCGSDCNFDADISLCNWENVEDEDNFDWEVSRGSLKTWTGPTRDQSTSENGGTSGGYAYIDSAWPRRPGDRARLKMSSILKTEADNPLCLSFYVSMFGASIGSLEVMLQDTTDSSTTRPVWRMERPSSSPRDMWHRAQVTLASESEVNVILEAIVGETDRGDLAIDTVRLDPGPCVLLPAEAAVTSFSRGCSFNTDKCGFLSQNVPAVSSTQYSTDMWTRVTGGSGRYPRGHRSDEDDKDFFMSFDVKNYGFRALDRGYLLGPQIPTGPRPLCIGFWVFMSTEVASVPHLGSLRLLLIPRNVTGLVDSSAEPRVIWSLTNQQQSSWFYAQASFSPTVPFLPVFEGLRANSVLGYIGLDDINIFEGECSLIPERAASDPRDCSFDFDPCSWRSMNPSSGQASDLRPQDWKLANRNAKLGDFNDHTFNLESRGYLFFETLNLQTKTWLASPPVEANTNLCLEFWFAGKLSDSTSTANLIVKRQFSNGTMGEEWRLELNQGDDSDTFWRPAMVPLASLDSRSIIFIEGNSNGGGFAIDDVKVTA